MRCFMTTTSKEVDTISACHFQLSVPFPTPRAISNSACHFQLRVPFPTPRAISNSACHFQLRVPFPTPPCNYFQLRVPFSTLRAISNSACHFQLRVPFPNPRAISTPAVFTNLRYHLQPAATITDSKPVWNSFDQLKPRVTFQRGNYAIQNLHFILFLCKNLRVEFTASALSNYFYS